MQIINSAKNYYYKTIGNGQSLKAATFNLLFCQGLVSILFLSIDFFISHHYSLKLFGTWKQLQIIINLILPMLAFGLPEGYKYFISHKPENLISYKNNVYSILLVYALFVVIASLFLATFFLDFYFNNKLLNGAKYLFGILFFSIFLNRIIRYEVVFENKSQFLLISTIYSFLMTLIILLLIYLFKNEINDSQFSTIILGVISFFYLVPGMAYVYKNHLKLFSFEINREVILNFMQIGFPLYLATFLGIIVSNIDKTIVAKYETVERFGLYATGALEIPIFSMLSASFSQSTFPKYVAFIRENNKAAAIQLWLKITNKVSLITYPILLILMIFAKSIFVLIYTDKYLSAVVIFKTFLLVCLWRNNYYGSLISASGKTKWLTFYSVINLVLMLGGSYFFYNLFGIAVLPWVLFCSTCFVASIQLFHEDLFIVFIKNFVLKPINLILIICIILAYIYSPY